MIKVVVVVPGTIPEALLKDIEDDEDDGKKCTLMN